MDVRIEPKEALTGFLNLPGIGKIRLDFLITYESDAYYIRCLDFGIMSCGDTIEECQENIKEAILIYLEDLPERQNLFKPAPAKYWQLQNNKDDFEAEVEVLRNSQRFQEFLDKCMQCQVRFPIGDLEQEIEEELLRQKQDKTIGLGVLSSDRPRQFTVELMRRWVVQE